MADKKAGNPLRMPAFSLSHRNARQLFASSADRPGHKHLLRCVNLRGWYVQIDLQRFNFRLAVRWSSEADFVLVMKPPAKVLEEGLY